MSYANAAVEAVIGNPGRTYNPLYIYGDAEQVYRLARRLHEGVPDARIFGADLLARDSEPLRTAVMAVLVGRPIVITSTAPPSEYDSGWLTALAESGLVVEVAE